MPKPTKSKPPLAPWLKNRTPAKAKESPKLPPPPKLPKPPASKPSGGGGAGRAAASGPNLSPVHGIKPPEWLVTTEGYALAEFRRVIGELKGKVSQFDLSLLCDYALVFEDCILLRETCRNEPEVLEGAKGGSYVNPIQNLLVSKQNTLSQLRRDLYLTPKSRAQKPGASGSGKARSVLSAINNGMTSEQAAGERDEED